MQKAIEAVERRFKAIETGNVSDADYYIAEDYINLESADDGRSEKRGWHEFRETVEWLRSAFCDLHFENVDVIACGNRVVVVTYRSGQHTASFLGLPATNRSFR
jgi:nogalonic acid methyl ester cyclase / aklanonic acid methyl ester cyclase